MSTLLTIVVICVAAVVLTSPVFGGTHVSVGARSVVITMRGLDKLWALRSSIAVPLDNVRDVRVEDTRDLSAGWRTGTAIPGWITSGTYRRAGEKAFWNVRRAKRVLVLDVSDSEFDRIVLEVDDPDRVARGIRS